MVIKRNRWFSGKVKRSMPVQSLVLLYILSVAKVTVMYYVSFLSANGQQGMKVHILQ